MRVKLDATSPRRGTDLARYMLSNGLNKMFFNPKPLLFTLFSDNDQRLRGRAHPIVRIISTFSIILRLT